MKKSIFILFMISGLFKGYSQISNYKYLDEDTRKTVVFDKYFHLFYSLKDYEVENVFFLKNGILLWDKIHSKFTLLDYNSKTMLDEYTLSSKKGFKKKNYNYYNPFIFNAQSKPTIIDKDKVFIGLVKTKRKLGYKGFQILNLSIKNNRIILNLDPFKPDKIFHGFEYINPNFPSVKYELAEGLAALQLVNALPIDTNNSYIYQFFGYPFKNSNKKEKINDHHVFHPVLLLKEKNKTARILLGKEKEYKSNLNLFEIVNTEDDAYIYRSSNDMCYDINDSSYYFINYDFHADSLLRYDKSIFIIDRKSGNKYIVKEFINSGNEKINYKYFINLVKNIDKTKKIINTSLVLTINTERKLDILSVFDKKIVIKKQNPMIPNEVGLYTIEFDKSDNIIYDIKMKGQNTFGQIDKKTGKKLDIGKDFTNEYRLIETDSFDIFDFESIPLLRDTQICQQSIKCLLKTVSSLLKNKNYKYVFGNLMVYDDDDIEMLRKNRNLFKNASNLEYLTELYSKAYKDYENAIWIKDGTGIIEGQYSDFIIFALFIKDKYFLSVKMIK